MVNTALPEDLVAMGVLYYIHAVLQGRSEAIGVEDARIEENVEMSMLQWRQLSEILSEDGGWQNGLRILQHFHNQEVGKVYYQRLMFTYPP